MSNRVNRVTNDYLNRYHRVIHPLEVFTLVACTILSFLSVHVIGYDGLNPISYAGTTLDVFCIMICMMFYISLYMDKHHSLGNERFMMMFTISALILSMDVLSWFVDGNPDLRVLNLIGRYGKNILLFVFTLSFWKYLKMSVNIGRRRAHTYNMIIYVLFLIVVIMLAVNMIYHELFDVGADGVYRRGPLLFLFFSLMIMMLFIGFHAIITSKSLMRERLIVSICIAISIVFTTLQFFRQGLSLIYTTPVVILVIVHINIYLSRCEELAQTQAELNMRKYDLMFSQVQPHFLFNAMSSIMAIEGNPSETVEALSEFGTILRHNLDQMSDDMPVPFDSELEHVSSYLYIEKLRFKDRLEVVWDLQNTKFMVPPTTLQPLVENAVRHGVSFKPGGGTITISSRIVENGHVIEIRDDGLGFDVEEVKNSDNNNYGGLKSIARRTRELVNGSLDVRSEIGKGTTITLFIPFNRSRSKN